MIENNLSENYDYFEDEEEIDIVKLVSTNANDANQYLLFHGLDNEYYAKNVSKIEEIVVFKNLNIVKNYDKNIIIGVADVRGEMLSLINFDNWLSGFNHDDTACEFVIIVNYGGQKFGLVVRNVEYIITIEPENMHSTVSGNSKSTFTTKINLHNKESLCTIIDSDKMLMDAFSLKEEKIQNDLHSIDMKVDSKKIVLLADDSKLVQKLLHKVCTQMKLNYKVLDDGKQLLNELKKYHHSEIGLLITDIEMPVLGGKEVIKQIRNDSIYNNLNILVHTNMANDVMEKELIKLGANEIICKVDVPTLGNAIRKYIK